MSTNEFIKRATKTFKKRTDVLEVDIEEAYCDHAKSRKCLPLKLVLLNRKGFPDRTTICPGGKIIFIEFKRKKAEAEGIQGKWETRLLNLGFRYHVCYKIGQAEETLDQFLKQ